jgi:hypothetical protein
MFITVLIEYGAKPAGLWREDGRRLASIGGVLATRRPA